jgi:8-oxo-dGTP pyrophosphatase MutT (NUDIX family)
MAERAGRKGPKYRQIADDLRARIAAGEFSAGDQLPTKAALQERYGVALNTADRAIDELRRAGIAETIHGSGTYLREPAPPQIPAWGDEVLRRLGQLEQRVGDLEAGPATRPEKQPVVAAILTSRHGVLVTRRRDGKPPWAFVGGEVDQGESAADAGIREVKEETGITALAGHEIGRRIHPVTGRLMIYMAARPSGSTEAHIGDPDELAEVRWVGLAEITDLMPDLFPPVQQYLERTLA